MLYKNASKKIVLLNFGWFIAKVMNKNNILAILGLKSYLREKVMDTHDPRGLFFVKVYVL